MLDNAPPDVQFALDAARKAALITRQVQEDMAHEGATKSDLSPVTVADYAVQAVVARLLSDRFPDDVLVGEEAAGDLRTPGGAKMLGLVAHYTQLVFDHASGEQVCDWIDRGGAEPGRRYWTVDPVDGTKGYLRGEQYAIALALVEEGQVQLGVLACPSLAADCAPEAGKGALLMAQRGGGAWNTPLDKDAFAAISVSDRTSPVEARLLRSVEAGHTNVDQIEAITEALGSRAEPVLMDSQAKYAVLAAGHAELLLRLLSPKKPDYKEKIWDQAAGSIILEEAGGKVTDLAGDPLDFGQGRTLANNRGLVASNGAIHDAALAAVKRVTRGG